MLELFAGLKWIVIYFVICASAAIVLRLTVKIPDEIFRKLLHCILLGSLSVWVVVFSQWWITAVTALGFAILVYPLLCLAERLKGYSEVVTERSRGELKASLLVVFTMYALVVAVCWGIFSDRYLVLASVYAWGFGDAAAALVGKRFGRHKFGPKIAGGKKSKEGTAAMFLVSFLCVSGVLLLRGGMPVYGIAVTAAATAAVSAAVELFTKDGMDTITCPLAAMVVLLLLVSLFGGNLL